MLEKPLRQIMLEPFALTMFECFLNAMKQVESSNVKKKSPTKTFQKKKTLKDGANIKYISILLT